MLLLPMMPTFCVPFSGCVVVEFWKSFLGFEEGVILA
jgi:hypothetical protein